MVRVLAFCWQASISKTLTYPPHLTYPFVAIQNKNPGQGLRKLQKQLLAQVDTVATALNAPSAATMQSRHHSEDDDVIISEDEDR
jgi:hypothetical protein